jgi:hypothetical protein
MSRTVESRLSKLEAHRPAGMTEAQRAARIIFLHDKMREDGGEVAPDIEEAVRRSAVSERVPGARDRPYEEVWALYRQRLSAQAAGMPPGRLEPGATGSAA